MRGLKRYLTHSFWAILSAWFPGFAVYILLESFFKEPLLPAALVGGALAGYFVNRRMKDSSASFVWILPLLVLVYDIADEMKYFSETWAHETLSAYIWNNYFGTRCGGSECLGELFFTGPFLSSVAYSIAAFLTLREYRARAAGTPS